MHLLAAGPRIIQPYREGVSSGPPQQVRWVPEVCELAFLLGSLWALSDCWCIGGRNLQEGRHNCEAGWSRRQVLHRWGGHPLCSEKLWHWGEACHGLQARRLLWWACPLEESATCCQCCGGEWDCQGAVHVSFVIQQDARTFGRVAIFKGLVLHLRARVRWVPYQGHRAVDCNSQAPGCTKIVQPQLGRPCLERLLPQVWPVHQINTQARLHDMPQLLFAGPISMKFLSC